MEQRVLRVLVAGPPGPRFDQVARTVAELSHDVIARASSLPDVARTTHSERPDVAVVIVREASPEALTLIDHTVHEAACPVIAVLDVEDTAFILAAAERGIFAYIVDGTDPNEMQSSIDIVLRRFGEYQDLEGAFARRASIERAKGILMERHGITEREAFEMLRERSRASHRKLIDLAEVVVIGHPLLPAREPHPSAPDTSR